MFCSVLVKLSNICTIMFSFFIFHLYIFFLLPKFFLLYLCCRWLFFFLSFAFLLWLRKYFLVRYVCCWCLCKICIVFVVVVVLSATFCRCLQFFLTLCTLWSFNIVCFATFPGFYRVNMALSLPSWGNHAFANNVRL